MRHKYISWIVENNFDPQSVPGLSPILKTVRVTFLSIKLSSLSAWISTRIVSATFSSSSIWGSFDHVSEVKKNLKYDLDVRFFYDFPKTVTRRRRTKSKRRMIWYQQGTQVEALTMTISTKVALDFIWWLWMMVWMNYSNPTSSKHLIKKNDLKHSISTNICWRRTANETVPWPHA